MRSRVLCALSIAILVACSEDESVSPAPIPSATGGSAGAAGASASGAAGASIGGASGTSSGGASGSGGVKAYPQAEIQISVDEHGISHVYAQSDEDALYGGGYTMAKDRLLEMETSRRTALGTMAELFGSSQLTGDIGARTFHFGALAAADWARLQTERPGDAALVTAWVKGVNARIAEVRAGTAPTPYGLGSGADELNFIPADWTEQDAFAVGKTLAFGLSDSFESEILTSAVMAVAPDFAKTYPLLLPGFDAYPIPAPGVMTGSPKAPKMPAFPPPLPPGTSLTVPWNVFPPPTGSNNWVVSGAHTDTGKPYLCGDPHQPLNSPSRFWPVHLSSAAAGGSLDVIGFAFVGTPAVQLGHNAHVGWTATTNFADVMDMWSVDLTPDGGSIQFADGAHAISPRTEMINVRKDGGAPGDTSVMPITIQDVPGYGVILPLKQLLGAVGLVLPKYVLFNWTGFAPTEIFPAFLGMDRATNIDEWEAAIDTLEVGAVNTVGADANSISYHVHSLIPDRGDPSSHEMPWHILEGTDAKSVWTGAWLSTDKLPALRDPEKGWIATGNDDPFGFTADGDVSNDPYYYGALYASGHREYRMEQLLKQMVASGTPITRAQMETMQGDDHSVGSDAFLPKLADAIGALDTDPSLAKWKGRDDLVKLAAALASWDRNMDRDAGEPVIFLGLEWFAAKVVLEQPVSSILFDAIASKSPPYLLGALRNVLDDRFQGSETLLPNGKRAVMMQALDDTSAWLMARFGTLDPSMFAWKDIHAATFPTPVGGMLDVGRFAVNGSADTVSVSEAPFFQSGSALDGPTAMEPLQQFSATAGPIYRMVIGFGDDGVPEATVDFARGVSGEPSDPHFGDQQDLWENAGHEPLWFREADVQMHTESMSILHAAAPLPFAK